MNAAQASVDYLAIAPTIGATRRCVRLRTDRGHSVVVQCPQNRGESLKEKMMKMIAAVLVSTMAFGVANAQAPVQQASFNSSTTASGSTMSSGDAKRDSAVEKHIAEMHRTLKITAAEEAQWNEVADTMRANARDLDRAIDERDASRASGTAVDDLDSYAAIAQVHADSVKKLAGAFSALYAAMSADQKAAADAAFSHRGHAARKNAKP